MGWSTNEKAQEKREKEAAKKKKQHSEKQQAKEKAKWKDQETEKKIETAQQKQARRQEELQRKRKLKQLVEQEEAEMAAIEKKKEKFAQKKLTQAEIQRRQEQALVEQFQKSLGNEQEQYFKVENPNRNFEGFEVANTVEKALEILDGTDERHPQRRYKAAFQAYCEKREAEIKIDYPKFKRSKRLDIMRKEFEKHPQNPYNKKNVVAYNYNPKKVETAPEADQ